MNSSEKSGSTRLFWIVILGIVLYVVLDVIAQVLPPHYSPISQAESLLAVGPYGWIMTINFLNRGILALLFIYAFLKTVDLAGAARSEFRTGTYLLGGAWGVGAILLAIFQANAPSTPLTWHAAVHAVVALIAFTGGAFGALAISLELKEKQAFTGLRRIALPLSLLAVVLWVVEISMLFFFHHLNSEIGGLTERLFLGSVLLWIGAVSAYLAAHGLELKKEE